MKEFKIGDKVSVYDNGKRQVGYVGLIGEHGNLRVDAVKSQMCDSWEFGWFHPKQLRRITKPKKRREFWLRFNEYKHPEMCAPEPLHKRHVTDEVIHVREVRQRKAQVQS